MKTINKIISAVFLVLFLVGFATGCTIGKKTYNINFASMQNGTISCDTNKVESGLTINLNVMPNLGYKLQNGSLEVYTENNVVSVSANNSFVMPDSDVTIYAVFVRNEKNIVISTYTNGTITSNKQTAIAGETITLTITPDTGYKLSDNSLKYNSITITPTNNTATFTMPNFNAEIYAQFESIIYTITKNITGQGTVILNRTTAAYGQSITLNIYPETGYQFKEGTLKYNTTSLTPTNNEATFTMPNCSVVVYAEFVGIPHSIIINTYANGSVSSDKTTAIKDEIVTLTVNPSLGYRLKINTLMNGTNVITVTDNIGTFAMSSQNVTIYAQFELAIYSITINPMTNGSVTANRTTAPYNQSVILTISANSGYRLKSGTLKYNTTTINASISTVTILMPNTNIIIYAEFEVVPFNITIGTVNNGTVVTDKTTAYEGDTITLTLNPDTNQKLKPNSLKYASTVITEINGNTATFIMPNQSVTITAQFENLIIGNWNLYSFTSSSGTYEQGDVLTDLELSYIITPNLFTLYFDYSHFVLNSAYGAYASTTGNWGMSSGQYTLLTVGDVTLSASLLLNNTMLAMNYANGSVARYTRQNDEVALSTNNIVGEYNTESVEYDGIKYSIGQSVDFLYGSVLSSMTFYLTMYSNYTFEIISTVPNNSVTGTWSNEGGYYCLIDEDYYTYTLTFNNDGTVLAKYYQDNSLVVNYSKMD